MDPSGKIEEQKMEMRERIVSEAETRDQVWVENAKCKEREMQYEVFIVNVRGELDDQKTSTLNLQRWFSGIPSKRSRNNLKNYTLNLILTYNQYHFNQILYILKINLKKVNTIKNS